MMAFDLARAKSVKHAIELLSANRGAKLIAGGTNLVDLMKESVETPGMLVDITRLPLDTIDVITNGGLSIGALATNSAVAYDAAVQASYPLLSSAILAGASPQLRNMASTGGNLLQRTRCYYFYDTATACNKRVPGSGCSAIGGLNRIHAILGTSEQCIATHPSDMCVALAALDAVVCVAGPRGQRRIAFEDFHRLPGDTPQIDTNLEPDEIIIAVELPAANFGNHYAYLKVRDRASYAFALVSVAAALELDGDKIVRARIALGGVAHKPWRDRVAERSLTGQAVGRAPFEAFATALLQTAKPQSDNAFKIDLAHRAIVRALKQATAGASQVQSSKSFQ